jgi:hypothetical protein
MQYEWQDHTIEVTGSWAGKYLYLAPEYTLMLDGDVLESLGGPRMRPELEAIIEDEEGNTHHIKAQLLSLAGFRPMCTLSIGEEIVAEEKIRVQNLLNPFLVLFILLASMGMLYVGPEVIRGLLK